jgi:hypothetical protein
MARRGFESVSDMVRSLGLVLLAVGVVVLITLRQAPEQAAPTVDPAAAVAAAEAAGTLPVPAVPEIGGWRVTSARYEAGPPSLLAIGYQTAAGDFAGYSVTDGDLADAVTGVAPEATPDGAAPVAGWQRWTAPDRQVWVTQRDGATLVLVATAGEADLRRLAAELSPA